MESWDLAPEETCLSLSECQASDQALCPDGAKSSGGETVPSSCTRNSELDLRQTTTFIVTQIKGDGKGKAKQRGIAAMVQTDRELAEHLAATTLSSSTTIAAAAQSDEATQTQIETRTVGTMSFPHVHQQGSQTSNAQQPSSCSAKEDDRDRGPQRPSGGKDDPLGGYDWAPGQRFQAAKWEETHRAAVDRRYYYVLELPKATNPYRLYGVHASIGATGYAKILKENEEVFHQAAFKNEPTLEIAYKEYVRRQVFYPGAPSAVQFVGW